MLSDGEITAWWTQYPEEYPVLTGWIPSMHAERLKDKSDGEVIDIGIASLVSAFKTDKSLIQGKLIKSKVINWPQDPFTKGAYSYSAVGAEEAYEELRRPIDNKIYFAGEALASIKETATVEGALLSGIEVANKILKV